MREDKQQLTRIGFCAEAVSVVVFVIVIIFVIVVFKVLLSPPLSAPITTSQHMLTPQCSPNNTPTTTHHPPPDHSLFVSSTHPPSHLQIEAQELQSLLKAQKPHWQRHYRCALLRRRLQIGNDRLRLCLESPEKLVRKTGKYIREYLLRLLWVQVPVCVIKLFTP